MSRVQSRTSCGLILLVLANCFINFANASVFRRHAEGIVDPMKFVPTDFTEAFKGFSADIVANEIFVEHSKTFGASASYTFGLGQFLATLNERVFNIPNDGINEALRTKYDAITTAYKDMTESLVEDSNVYISNTIYTSNRTLEPTMGAKELMTHVFYQDFSQPHIVVPVINARIAIQTFAKIYDRLIPRGGWYGPSIYSFTKGLYINTFFYKNKFLFPFTDIGKDFFGTDRVRMLASGGTFKVKKTDNFMAVALPFKDKRKSLVLVLPKGDLQQLTPFLEDAMDLKKSSGIVETRPVVVQLPALNFTISNEYFSQFYYMGVNNSMCNWNSNHAFFLQPPAQALYYSLDTEKFEVAAATGAQLNNNQEFQDITGIRSRPSPEPQKDDENQNQEENEKNTTNEPSKIASQFDSDEEDSDEDLLSSKTPLKQYKFLVEDESEEIETLRFDKPFYWFLQDEVLGPIYVGIVNSFKTYKEQVASIEDGFDDMFKYQFWACGPKQLALIDMFNSPVPASPSGITPLEENQEDD